MKMKCIPVIQCRLAPVHQRQLVIEINGLFCRAIMAEEDCLFLAVLRSYDTIHIISPCAPIDVACTAINGGIASLWGTIGVTVLSHRAVRLSSSDESRLGQVGRRQDPSPNGTCAARSLNAPSSVAKPETTFFFCVADHTTNLH